MKTYRKASAWLAACAVSLCAAAAHAGAIDDLKRFNSDTDGLSGGFSQTVKSKKKNQSSSGSFQILRPGLFKWDYTKPYRQTIVGDGKTIWLYDQDLKQVTKSDQDQTIGDSPAAILSNKSALESSYSLKEDGSAGGIDYVLATPKKNNAGYQFIRIGFKGGQLAAMELKDGFGNQTSIRFRGINTKPNLSKGTFKFVPPKGVDVLSQ
ncbi:outer membrane lipoprotein chaperone LolA [Conchiformibius steedae]|uniref:Outer-membrane lipoprotein carrier protein n=1 Tax=Conchiformibius steedae TaxID=153493 RepID=A0A3P2A513_9NEIS|nr:outer membrane lipoprotein chaperone LolA [Conchiformibius steedae]RRD89988.1 outer membrane lipoprotein carrier protein LolA [Conchiformibius steedae]